MSDIVDRLNGPSASILAMRDGAAEINWLRCALARAEAQLSAKEEEIARKDDVLKLAHERLTSNNNIMAECAEEIKRLEARALQAETALSEAIAAQAVLAEVMTHVSANIMAAEEYDDMHGLKVTLDEALATLLAQAAKMLELQNSVHCLIFSMIERGVGGADPWWGQDFLSVKRLLEDLGLNTDPKLALLSPTETE